MTATHTRRINALFHAATFQDHIDGMSWYNDAHDLAASFGDVWRAAGVIAAYSPLTPWWRNVELASDSLATGRARTDSLGNSVRAAQRILDGEPALDVLNGNKVRAFCENIATNGVTDAVTVDVHAYSIAMGVRIPSSQIKGLGKREYADIAQSYRNAAKRAGIAPSQMQAVTWVAWRNLHNVNPGKAA